MLVLCLAVTSPLEARTSLFGYSTLKKNIREATPKTAIQCENKKKSQLETLQICKQNLNIPPGLKKEGVGLD